MFTLLVIAYISACVLVARARGGRLDRAIPGLIYPILGVLVQWPVGLLFPGTLLARAANIGGFLLLVPFWWLNRRGVGVTVLVTGILLNLTVILLNAGMMPVDAARAASVGIPMGGKPLAKHQPIMERTILPVLGDLIPVAPLHKVVSAGDLVACVGLFFSIQEWMGLNPLKKAERM